MSSESKAEEPTDPDALRDEIADAREELGDTVEALASKADVKGQAKAKVDETTQEIKENPQKPAAVAGGVLVLLIVLFLLRRRSSR